MAEEYLQARVASHTFRVKPGYLYTPDGLWVAPDEVRRVVRIGLTDCSDVTRDPIAYVELPERGMALDPGEDLAAVESCDDDHWLLLPFGGTIVRLNQDVLGTPDLVTRDPYGDGWLVEVRPDEWPVSGLLEPWAYLELLCRREAAPAA